MHVSVCVMVVRTFAMYFNDKKGLLSVRSEDFLDFDSWHLQDKSPFLSYR